jgi:hypothetical protein
MEVILKPTSTIGRGAIREFSNSTALGAEEQIIVMEALDPILLDHGVEFRNWQSPLYRSLGPKRKRGTYVRSQEVSHLFTISNKTTAVDASKTA